MDEYNNKSPASSHFAIAISGFALLGLFAATAESQTDESVIVDVGACVDIEDREEQLECYESRVNEMLRVREFERSAGRGETAAADAAPAEVEAAADTVPVAVAAPARSAQSQQTAEPELSRAERRAQRRAERQQAEADAAADEAAAAADAAAEAAAVAALVAESPSSTTATVTAVREIEPDKLLITLDNGQIWRQNRAGRYPLRVGANVVLRPSRWGPSYRLTDPSVGGFIQVERRR